MRETMKRVRERLFAGPRARAGEDVTVVVSAATATASASASIAVQTQLLLHWSDIAIAQERLAWDGRRKAEQLRDEAVKTGQGLPIEIELRASMIAIAAASHALDALYGELRDLALPAEIAQKWKDDSRSGPPRPRKLQETLKHGFKISAQQWEEKLDELFALRDAVVHPETLFHEPAEHPLGVNTAREYVIYRCVRATEAVDLLMEILEICVDRPKPGLEEWVEKVRQSVSHLKSERAGSGPASNPSA